MNRNFQSVLNKHSQSLGPVINSALTSGLPAIRGNWFAVDPYGATDGLKPHDYGFQAIYSNLLDAYNACTSGRGDGIVVISGGTGTASQTSSYLSYPITWSKHGITVVGMASSNGYFGRARITNVEHTTGSIATLAFVQGSETTYDKITDSAEGFVDAGFVAGDIIRVNTTGNGADATGLVIAAVTAGTLTLATIGTLVTETAANAGASVVTSYCPQLITVSGSNNAFYNLHLTNGSSDAAALGCVSVTGNRNYFNNCHFIGTANATPAAVTTAYDIQVVASEIVFDNCYFGTNSTVYGAANGHIKLGLSTTQIGQVFFNDCHVISYSNTAGHGAINVTNAATLGGWIQFKRCSFVNWYSGNITTLTTAVIGATPNNCGILLQDCAMVGWAAWCANEDRVYTSNAAGAAGTGGIGGTIA